MGGDHGPAVAVPAAVRALAGQPDLSLILVGDQDAVLAALPRGGKLPQRCEIRHTTQVVAMDESPVRALRSKRDSSMWMTTELVRSGRAQACVSAGNTGALMVIARHVLKMIPGIERPAIARFLPTPRGQTLVLDLGANTECSAEQLCQFAIMGAVLAEVVTGNPQPSVGLLNVGTEASKGTDIIQGAAALIAATGLRYHGFVEGNDIYQGTVDVVVSDGFAGNVALKTSEGLARMFASTLREEFGRNLLTRTAALVAWPVLRSLRERLDPRRYNGASLLGLAGPVVKSHGGTDELGFACAIDEAMVEARSALAQRIAARVSQYLPAAVA